MLNILLNQVPYTCRLFNSYADGSFSHGCGVFVSPVHVLTAWHVLERNDKNFVRVSKTALRGGGTEIIDQNVIKSKELDFALMRLRRPLSKSYLKVISDFEDIEGVMASMASPNYRFNKVSRGHYLGPNLDYRPNENGVRPKAEFQFSTYGRNGMSGSPIINEDGKIMSVYTHEASVIKKLRRFRRPIGNDMGPHPQRLIEFFEPYRQQVESFHL